MNVPFRLGIHVCPSRAVTGYSAPYKKDLFVTNETIRVIALGFVFSCIDHELLRHFCGQPPPLFSLFCLLNVKSDIRERITQEVNIQARPSK